MRRLPKLLPQFWSRKAHLNKKMFSFVEYMKVKSDSCSMTKASKSKKFTLARRLSLVVSKAFPMLDLLSMQSKIMKKRSSL